MENSHHKFYNNILEYPVSVVLCKILYRLVGEFGMTRSEEEEGGKKENTEGKKSCFY
jgi:hypothetical protein